MITFVVLALAAIPTIAATVWVQDSLTEWKWRAIAHERRHLRWAAAGDARPLPFPRNVTVLVIALFVRGED